MSGSCEDRLDSYCVYTLTKLLRITDMMAFFPLIPKSDLSSCNLLSLCQRGAKQPLSKAQSPKCAWIGWRTRVLGCSVRRGFGQILQRGWWKSRRPCEETWENKLRRWTPFLSRRTEDIKTIRSDTTELQQRVSNTEKTAADWQKDLQTLNKKLVDLDDRSCRDRDLLLFNLKKRG